jgi:hypothetical protein
MDKRIASRIPATILGLIAVHVAATAFGALISADQPAPSSAFFLAVIFCQAGLIGMWGGLGGGHWMLRLGAAFCGAALLGLVLGLGIGELDHEIYVLTFIATFLVAGPMWIVRVFFARLALAAGGTASSREGLQFTIKHLMLLTLAVACLTTVGKTLAPYIRGIDLLTDVVLLGICFVVVALTAVWAMLGLGHPGLRIVPVLSIAAASGWAAAYLIGRTDFGFWIGTALLEAVFLIASLAAIRTTGLRLVAAR